MTHTLIIVNLGTTEAPTPEAVRRFLAEFIGDPMVVDWPRWLWLPVLHGIVLRTRPARVAKLYASIWSPEGPPLRVATEALAESVRTLVGDGRRGDGGVEGVEGAAPDYLPRKVRTAYRYADPARSPALAQTLIEAAAEGPVTVVSLFPHQTASTTGTIDVLVAETVKRHGLKHPVRVIHPEPDDEGFIEAVVARWDEARAQAGFEPEHLIFSYHGIPTRHDRREGEVYSRGCRRCWPAWDGPPTAPPPRSSPALAQSPGSCPPPTRRSSRCRGRGSEKWPSSPPGS